MADPKKAAGDNNPAANNNNVEKSADQLKAELATLEALNADKDAIISRHENTIDEKDQEIAELKKEIVSQNELIAEMGTTIEGYDAKIAALKYKASIGDTTVEVEFEGKTYAVKNAIRLAGKVIKPTDVADNVALYVPKILALGDQLTLVEITKEKEEA